ncbi:MAG: nucleotidyltransferase family protein [Lachnospiraceae bacterium]|nr:nucleotidyltransferase family protein [Lachnospiraceae bacterium]
MHQIKNIKICGIVAEYNPFHKGHLYQLKMSKKLTGSEGVVIVMSGDFVQRGAPAICSKYQRAKMALLSGADVVIELPALYALSSAEDFAGGSVGILNATGVVDTLSFGSECGDTDHLMDIAKKVCESGDTLSEKIRSGIRTGLSYASSLSSVFVNNPQDSGLLKSPNNILGIEYCKAIIRSGSSMVPFTIKRNGQDHNSSDIDPSKKYASASAIRGSILEGKNEHSSFIPGYVETLLNETPKAQTSTFNDIMYYSLLKNTATGYTDYLGVNFELSSKIIKDIDKYKDIDSFINLLKSKNMTYTGISRCLFHIMLGIKKEDVQTSPRYIRILGFKKDSSDILHMMKEQSSLPIITKLADSKQDPMLSKDIFCSRLYDRLTGNDFDEYRSYPVII